MNSKLLQSFLVFPVLFLMFLFFHPPAVQAAGSPQSVTVSAYYDYNLNGVQDAGEPNVAGYTISMQLYQCVPTCPLDDGVPSNIVTGTSPVTITNLSENRIIDVIVPQSAAASNGLKFYNSATLQRRNGGPTGTYYTYTINPDGHTSFSSTNTKHTNALLALGVSDNLDNANWFIKFALQPLNPISASCSPNGGTIVGRSITWNASVSGGISPYGYQWSMDGGGFVAGGASNTQNYVTSGTKTSQVKVTDNIGFSSTSGVCSVYLDTVIPPPPPDIIPLVTCINPNFTGDGFIIRWTNNDTPVSWVDISTEPSFPWWWAINVTTSPNTQFDLHVPNNITGVVFQPDQTYYVRLYNGKHSGNGSFSATPCYSTIGGTIRESNNGSFLGGVQVQVRRRNDLATTSVNTDPGGNFRLSYFVRELELYDVYVAGNQANPQTAPSGYIPPAKTTSTGWNWNYCQNPNPGTNPWADTPPGSQSYECQKAASGVDCSGSDGSSVNFRCSFAYDKPPAVTKLEVQAVLSEGTGSPGSGGLGGGVFNPMRIYLTASSATKYYVAFYDKAGGQEANLNAIKTRLNLNPKDGFILAYGKILGSTNKYYVYNPTLSPPNWVDISTFNADINEYYAVSNFGVEFYRVGYSSLGTPAWRISMTDNFGDKNMYTAVQAENDAGTIDFRGDFTVGIRPMPI